jgi:hypothetical protein
MYMRVLVRERERAVALRKKGYSYKDILREVPVSKSSVSLWLQKLPLTAREKKYLKFRRNLNISHGRIKAAATLHELRLQRENILLQEARTEFQLYKQDFLFHVGIALYWAEGGKRTWCFTFTNSDAEMIDLMLKWVEKYLHISRNETKARLFIHKPYAHEQCEKKWSQKIQVPIGNFQKTIYKPTGLLIKKRPHYDGCLRIEIGKTALLRKMQFWQQMLIEYYRDR